MNKTYILGKTIWLKSYSNLYVCQSDFSFAASESQLLEMGAVPEDDGKIEMPKVIFETGTGEYKYQLTQEMRTWMTQVTNKLNSL